MHSMYNEIYGLYYYMLEKILDRASKEEITLKEINSIVSRYGFSESNLYFTPDLIAQGEGYNLLRESTSGFTSILKSTPFQYMTSLQKSFLKVILEDEKIRLFLEDSMFEELKEAFSEVTPLFSLNDYVLTENALDSDPYTDEEYIKHFRMIISAIKGNHALKICFHNSKGERKTMKLAPYKLEYGIRDDKFRLCGVRIFEEQGKNYVKINLARIQWITPLPQSYPIDFNGFIEAKKKSEPIEIEVSNLRNGFDRVFIGLSNYERVSSFNEETQKCRIKIYYTEDDEQELLILLLSYGPAIKVLGPVDFRNKLVERIRNQALMIHKP